MGTFSKKGRQGTTFSDFKPKMEPDPEAVKESIQALRDAAQVYKDERLTYYRNQMRDRTDVVNRLPAGAAVLAVIGILFTSGAVVVRTLSLLTPPIIDWNGGDIVMMAIAVVAYALMSGILIFERLTESSGGYFRAASTVVAIRDLWTAYTFADIGRSLGPKNDDGAREIARWSQPIEEFCQSLNVIVADEMTAWQAAYESTAKARSDTAEAGLAAAITQIKASADAAVLAATKAEEAARAAADAQAPATLNLSLGTATTAGTAVIKVDGREVASGTNQRSFSITQLRQGERHIRVEFTPAAAGSTMTPFEKSIRLGSGITQETITIP